MGPSSIGRPTQETLTPSGLERASATVIDIVILAGCCPLALTFFAVTMRGFWFVGALAGVVGYFAAGFASGQTPGMRVMRLHVTGTTPHGHPTRSAAAIRATFATAAIVAVLALVSLPSRPAGWSALVVTGVVGLTLSVFDFAWVVVDGAGRTLHERLTGTSVQREQAWIQRAEGHRSRS